MTETLSRLMEAVETQGEIYPAHIEGLSRDELLALAKEAGVKTSRLGLLISQILYHAGRLPK